MDGLDGSGLDVVDDDLEPAALDRALDDGGEAIGDVLRHLAAAADDLRPGAFRRRGVEAVAVLVGADDELHAVPREDRAPEVVAFARPVGVVVRVDLHAVVRVVRVVRRREERDVAEDDLELRRRDVGAGEGLFEPGGLGLAVGLEIGEAEPLRVAVRLVLPRVHADEGGLAHAHGEVPLEVPLCARALGGVAREHDLLLLRDPAAPEVMVAALEADGDVRRVVPVRDRRVEEDLDGRPLLLRRVRRVAVPDDQAGLERLHLLHDGLERRPLRVRVVHHREVRLRRRAERREGMDLADDGRAELRVVDVLVVRERRRHRAVPVGRRGLQALQAHLEGRDVDRHEAVAAALHRARVAHLRVVRKLDDTLREARDAPRDAHRRLARRLQARLADREGVRPDALERLARLRRPLCARRCGDRRRHQGRSRQKRPSVHHALAPFSFQDST